jgi:DNA polymerase-4
MAPPRKIIHCDCDCFYASIEMRDNPELLGKPIAVGGLPTRRGVVATCNYEARKFGIHSAMAAATARKLCPELIIIRPDMDKYREASRQIHEIFERYTAVIEPLSLDEAFLDVSDCDHHQGSATLIAEAIRSDVRETVNITISAGIAPNKFLAKIASDENKPDGQFVITPSQVDTFVQQLPVNK